MYRYQTETVEDLDDFLKTDERLYRLFWDCGMGKSYVLARWVKLHPELKFLYVTVNHKVCDNFEKELLDAGLSEDDMFHYWGKKDLCSRVPEQMYYPGCVCENREIMLDHYTYSSRDHTSYCSMKCLYKQQSTTKQVLLTVFELMGRFSEGRIVIIDESPEKLAVKPAYVFENDIKLGNTVTYKNRFGDESVYYTDVRLASTFWVSNDRTWKIAQFFKSCKHNAVVAYQHKKGYQLQGRNYDIVPDGKVIFACATTSIPYMEAVLGIPADRVNEQRKTILNPVIEVNHEWTKSFSEDNFEWLYETFLPSLSDNPDDIFISTKKMFAEKLTELGYHAPYHGNGRGINEYNREYKYIIAYCRFGAPIELNVAWELLGFNKAIIKQREVSESLQTFHRCRAHLHTRATPVILMTNKDIGINANIEISFKALQKLIGIDEIPKSLNKIAAKLHISKRGAKPVREVYKVLYQ